MPHVRCCLEQAVEMHFHMGFTNTIIFYTGIVGQQSAYLRSNNCSHLHIKLGITISDSDRLQHFTHWFPLLKTSVSLDQVILSLNLVNGLYVLFCLLGV